MPVDLWGASGSLQMAFPASWFGVVLLLLYGVGVGFLLYRYRADFRGMTAVSWGWLAGLSVAAFVCAQLFAIALPLGQTAVAGQPVGYVTLLAAAPVLLAGLRLHPGAALLVGAFAGLAQGWGESHEPFAMFNYALVGWGTAVLLQQSYIGRLYRWMRQPMVVGALGGVALAFLAGIAVLATAPTLNLAAIDRAAVVTRVSFWPRLLEGIVGGAVVLVVLRALPHLISPFVLVPSPTARSLQKRLNATFVGFVSVMVAFSLVVVYLVAIQVSTRLVVSQMGHNVAAISATIPELESVAADAPDKYGSLARIVPPDQRLLLLNADGEMAAFYPAADGVAALPVDWDELSAGLRPLRLVRSSVGQVYTVWNTEQGARDLVLVANSPAHEMTMVTAVPYAVVLEQAVGIGWPLLLVLLVGAALLYANIVVLGRDITAPINEMVQASKTLAAGGDWTLSHQVQRDDEIGQLQRAFAQMQRSTRKRLNELSLLLGVSHDVSTSIDMNQGIPAILRGALRGTGAAGARAVVLNPTGGNPLSFGEGPAAEEMAELDRQIMTRLRHASDLMLSTPNQIRAVLGLDKEMDPAVPSLLAIPLRSHERFQGILWLGFRQQHSFDLTERNLLATLATQAAVLVENAWLYSSAESGRRRLAAVLASTSDAVIVTEQTERILLVNRAAERIFGLDAAAVRGRPVAQVILNEKLVLALTGKDDRARNLEIPIGDGKTYYASASTIISNDGQVYGRVAVLRDITYLKEIDEMKSDFVATVSHDLRSPLTFMRGYATMLPMAGELNDKQGEYVGKILTGIDQMSQLVDDLLDMARIEAGVDLAQEPIEIRPLLQNIANEFWQHAHMAGIKVLVEVEENLPVIYGDTDLIRRALENLVGNAIKYAPSSGNLILGAEKVDGEVVFRIKDNGPGLTKQDQIRVFEKFHRVKEPGTERIKGSGLGLSIVKSIAERHGGRAWCYSQRGQGATFYLSVPIAVNGSTPTNN